MGFMEKQITGKERWAIVETNCGKEAVPIEQLNIALPYRVSGFVAACARILRDYLEGSEIFDVIEREGYGARLSAPGYLDSTDWTVFDTAKEAEDYLDDLTEGDD
jgi:hypothetical protein